MLTREELQRAAAEGGFDTESYEKVSVLVALLEGVRSHPYLGRRLVLKGGPALNLFVLDLPCLSVDIDLNYVGAADRDTMLAERPQVERAIEQVCGRQGVTVKCVPSDHAGGKWRLSYASALGGTRSLELDVNFVLRTPLWPVGFSDCRPVGGIRATRVAVLDVHELAAGKLAALFARSAARDLFDARGLLRRDGLDRAKLRLGFVVYGGANRRDWREVAVSDVTTTPAGVDAQLAPMLREGTRPRREDVGRWTESLSMPPTHFPLRRAALILSRVRSAIISRSNCAKLSRMWSISLPIEDDVSNFCVMETNATFRASKTSISFVKSRSERLSRSSL